MFDNLSTRLQEALRKVRGQALLRDDNIADALREVRMALLEADVALPVVKTFIDRVREGALGQEVARSLAPGQVFVKLVNDQLVAAMGEHNSALELRGAPPVVVLMAGLQGAGKTTTTAKLARHLKQQRKRVLLVSCDVYRPAAMEQLAQLASQVEVPVVAAEPQGNPVDIALQAKRRALEEGAEVLIVDTAGRLTVDREMMAEITALHGALNPAETLFVVDAMTGQDAANSAAAFGKALPLTGVILTKADGDARGGAALSVRQITGQPIKFLGVGEKLDALEPFFPERMASRILGMGDVVTLVEQAQQQVDQQKAQAMGRKLAKGKGFTFDDFREQLRMIEQMGGVGGMLDKLPGLPARAREQVDPGQLRRVEAIINSMTPQERRFPDIIKGSRRRRIAGGAGVQVQEINRLLKQFAQMQKMMKKLSGKGGMKKLMRGMGGMPPGMGNF